MASTLYGVGGTHASRPYKSPLDPGIEFATSVYPFSHGSAELRISADLPFQNPLSGPASKAIRI